MIRQSLLRRLTNIKREDGIMFVCGLREGIRDLMHVIVDLQDEERRQKGLASCIEIGESLDHIQSIIYANSLRSPATIERLPDIQIALHPLGTEANAAYGGIIVSRLKSFAGPFGPEDRVFSSRYGDFVFSIVLRNGSRIMNLARTIIQAIFREETCLATLERVMFVNFQCSFELSYDEDGLLDSYELKMGIHPFLRKRLLYTIHDAAPGTWDKQAMSTFETIRAKAWEWPWGSHEDRNALLGQLDVVIRSYQSMPDYDLCFLQAHGSRAVSFD